MNTVQREGLLSCWKSLHCCVGNAAVKLFDQGDVDRAVFWLERLIDADEHIARLEVDK